MPLRTIKAEPAVPRTFKPQLAVAWDKPLDKLEYPVIAEPKLDGVRCVCIIDDEGFPTFWSRDEKPFVNFEELEQEIKNLCLESGTIFDGEILAKSGSFDDTISRSRSHRGKNKHIDYKYYIFDIPSCEFDSLWERKEFLQETIKGSNLITIIPYKYIENSGQLFEYHKKNCRYGWEGTMIKNPYANYHYGRNKDWKKIKPFYTADLKIVSMSEGKGKAAGMMGRIVVEGRIEDREALQEGQDPCEAFMHVRCEVGTGFTDELRKELWNNRDKYIGQMVEIQYQEVTKDNSLRFPSFKRFRSDRD